LGTDQTITDVTLDAGGSHDNDGMVESYVWSGTPDPDDIFQPIVSLTEGKYTFTVVVTDDDGAVSDPDSVTITVLGIPQLAPLPEVTNATQVTLRGLTVPGTNVIVRGGADEATGQSSPDTGLFEIPVELNVGENTLKVYAQWQGEESPPAQATINCIQPTLALQGINPDSGQSGSIVDIAGAGFTADKEVMRVFFKGTQREGEGLVMEATETSMKVVVPFVFLNTEDDQGEVYVFNDTEASNSLPFHILPAADPTPGEAGNETTDQFDLLLIQVDRTFGKLERLVKPHLPEEKWSLVEENFQRLEIFLSSVKNGLPSIHQPETLSALDAIFSSDIFFIVNQKLELINEILSHSDDFEAACNVNEVTVILNETIDILDTAYDIVLTAEITMGVLCFFGCIPCCPTALVLEGARRILDVIMTALEVVRDIMNAKMAGAEKFARYPVFKQE